MPGSVAKPARPAERQQKISRKDRKGAKTPGSLCEAVFARPALRKPHSAIALAQSSLALHAKAPDQALQQLDHRRDLRKRQVFVRLVGLRDVAGA